MNDQIKKEDAVVKISYSVKLEEIPEVLNELFEKRITQELRILQTHIESTGSMCSNSQEMLNLIEKVRKDLFIIDMSLSDLQTLHSSYIAYLVGEKEETKKEDAKETNSE